MSPTVGALLIPTLDNSHTRCVPRYPFIVDIELIDMQSGITIKARTKNLSLFGCGVDTLEAFPRATNVGIKLSHGDEYILAKARVVYSSKELGMGVAFLGIEAEYERILDGWIVQLSTVNRAN
jgi:hypothetical protein